MGHPNIGIVSDYHYAWSGVYSAELSFNPLSMGVGVIGMMIVVK